MGVSEGDTHPVWWETGQRSADGTPVAKVMGVRPYTGRYPQFFTHVLQLSAPNTRRGWLEMTIKEGETT